MIATRQRVRWLSLLCVSTLVALTSATPALAQSTTWSCEQPAAASPVPTEAAGGAPPVTPIPFPEDGGSMSIFAAASLTDAFMKIKADLEATYPDLAITYQFAGSQALVTQLSQGAAADVLALANPQQMDSAIEQDVIAGDPAIFARNRLAIAVPTDNPAGIETAADLAKDDLKLVVAQPAVPAGQYARESICRMAADTAVYGDGFVEDVAANIVSAEDNVRTVLTKVQLGEADAGIVYVTDVTAAADEVVLIEIPDAVNVIATYPIAPVTGGNEELARAFIAYVLGPEGQATLQEFGFEPPSHAG